MNRESLAYHVSAGRLWSSLIQLTHQYRFHVDVRCRLYGSSLALGVFLCALQYVSKSGEVWCEGARIFMNPMSRHFHPLNAQRCLNFAVYFTPQYGDSFIEVLIIRISHSQAIRLSMITSKELLLFGRSNNPCFLSYLMSARDYHSIVNKCVYSDPNYGSCWFRAKLFPLGSAEEVTFRAIKFTAHEVAIVSNVYYDAMMDFVRRNYHKCVVDNGVMLSEKATVGNKLGIRNASFSYSFQPYQMITTPSPLTIGKKLKILFGTSQIEA